MGLYDRDKYHGIKCEGEQHNGNLALACQNGQAASTEASGKPYFPAYPEVHFSLSHTAGAAAVAVADTPVGVDIEHIRPVSVCTMERIAGVRTQEAFFRCWVRREARVKRTGAGIVTMMKTETPLRAGEFYYEISSFPGYAAGVATGEPAPPQKIQRLHLDELL